MINNSNPFLAKKINDSIWIIEGTLHQDMGGVPYAEVNIKTRKTIKITHGK
ncbi:NTF2 fold immunity protein [Elizabethkingia miricola]|uniref:NTF2 fold immunity protein n=1 Tax=Elizabethkingia miricola TaxID=172045 RepID=UPI0009995D43